MKSYIIRIIFLFIFFPKIVFSQVVTPDLEYVTISNVGYGWQTVSLGNTYTSPVVVCTNELPSSANKEAVVRLNAVGSSSFQVKIQSPNDSNPGYTTDVYCIISDEGSYTAPIKYEAHKVISDLTSGNSSPNNWNANRTEDVSNAITQSYTKPAVLGQVMSYNDNRFSVFWSFDCDNRANRPFQSGMNDGICVGKHVGQVPENRNSETLGYIVAEAGVYDLADFSMAIDYGANSIQGVGNTPPYSYTLDKVYTEGVVTKEAENGGQGGWAVLYGIAPIGLSLNMAIDEETVAGDTSRGHIAEEVAYWMFQYTSAEYADMVINEVLYNEVGGLTDFVEFYVTKSGTLKNYILSDQDNDAPYIFPDIQVNVGDYVVVHDQTGVNTSIAGVHHLYTTSSARGFSLSTSRDDLTLYKPVNTDITIVDGNPYAVVPVDYIAYGSGTVDSPPTSENGITVSWNTTYQGELGGAGNGESISLTPNGIDNDSSACWELTTSGNASNNGCPNYLPTTSTDPTYTNSQGKNNNNTAIMSVTKTSIVTADGVNASNPKRIPGATIRYCFTVDNTGIANADNATVNDSLTGTGKDNLIYVNSGFVVQDISTPCDCAAITDTSGIISGTDVTINMGTLTGTSTPATSRGCAYIEMTIK